MKKGFLVFLVILFMLSGCDAPSNDSDKSEGYATEKVTPIQAESQIPSEVTTPVFVTGRGNTVGNIVNYGLAAQEGDWIYYTTTNGLYKMHVDGSDKTRIGEPGLWINVIDGWAYYTLYDGKNYNGLYRMRTDGSDSTKISDDNACYVNVVDGWIYYSIGYNDKYDLYKVRTDGSQKTKLSDDHCIYINVVDDWIYYVNMLDHEFGADPDGAICKMRTDGTGKTTLLKDDAYCMNVADGWIYYSLYGGRGDDTIYKMRTDGSQNAKVLWRSTPNGINTLRLYYLNVADGWIYYRNINYTYKVPLERGGEAIYLNDEEVEMINVIGDWIFYYSSDEGWLYRVQTDGKERQMLGKLSL